MMLRRAVQTRWRLAGPRRDQSSARPEQTGVRVAHGGESWEHDVVAVSGRDQSGLQKLAPSGADVQMAQGRRRGALVSCLVAGAVAGVASWGGLAGVAAEPDGRGEGSESRPGGKGQKHVQMLAVVGVSDGSSVSSTSSLG